jgi:GNAT superfamily N-acetyltransferase
MRTEDCHVRPMRAADLAPAQGVVAAFGAAPAEPPDRTAPPRFPVPFLASRFAREPEGCFVALRGDGGVVGAVYSATRGSMGWLGPLAVAPWAQRQSIGRQLLEACLRRWATLGVALAGLEIDAADTGQHRLFGGAGFRADWLSVGLRRAAVGHGAAPPGSARVVPFSSLVPKERQARLAQVRALGERLYPGLDWTRELGLQRWA